MKRTDVRACKRAVGIAILGLTNQTTLADAKESAIALLDRSVALGHQRLAMLRLRDAARIGTQIPTTTWAYCEKVAAASAQQRCRTLYAEALHFRWAAENPAKAKKMEAA